MRAGIRGPDGPKNNKKKLKQVSEAPMSQKKNFFLIFEKQVSEAPMGKIFLFYCIFKSWYPMPRWAREFREGETQQVSKAPMG